MIYASLLAGALLPRKTALCSVLIMWIASDILLGLFNHYAFFGSWSLFTYSGAVAMVFLGQRLVTANLTSFCFASLAMSFAFWVWSNFGTWLASSIYPHDLNGLMACYIAALPFLKNQLLGDVAIAITITLLATPFSPKKHYSVTAS
jgi:hypothetical protein